MKDEEKLDEEKARTLIKLAAIEARKILDEAARMAEEKIQGFTKDDRKTLNTIEDKVDQVSTDIKDIPQND